MLLVLGMLPHCALLCNICSNICDGMAAGGSVVESAAELQEEAAQGKQWEQLRVISMQEVRVCANFWLCLLQHSLFSAFLTRLCL